MEISGGLLVFAAGVFTLFSPCAYPLLPGYIMYYLGSDTTFSKALLGGGICFLGLVSIFSIFGLLSSIVEKFAYSFVYWLVPIASIIIIIMGISMLVGAKIFNIFLPIKASGRKGFIGMFLYGIAYGLATFGCSAPIFFSILLFSIVSGGMLSGIITFLIYALGMGIPLILTTILVVKAKELVYRKILRAMPLIQKIGGVILIIIGIYLLYSYSLIQP